MNIEKDKHSWVFDFSEEIKSSKKDQESTSNMDELHAEDLNMVCSHCGEAVANIRMLHGNIHYHSMMASKKEDK